MILRVAFIAAILAVTSTKASTIYTGPNGTFNNDRWNTPANWSGGSVPTGVTDVTIEAGRKPSVNFGGTPAYTGDLTLEMNSQIEFGISATASDQDNALGTGSIFFNAGSRILMRTPNNTSNSQNLVMVGNGELGIGTSTSSHGRQRTMSGNITGSGNIGIRTTNRQSLTLTGDNSGFLGTMYIGDDDGAGYGNNLSENNRAALVAGSAEALPDLLQVGGGVNLRLNVANTINTLTIFGNKSDQQGNAKLFLNGVDLTVSSAVLDGTSLAPGTYNGASGLVDAQGNNLFGTSSGNLVVVAIPEPSSLVLIGFLAAALVARHGTRGKR